MERLSVNKIPALDVTKCIHASSAAKVIHISEGSCGRGVSAAHPFTAERLTHAETPQGSNVVHSAVFWLIP
jgi:hypothetical protein